MKVFRLQREILPSPIPEDFAHFLLRPEFHLHDHGLGAHAFLLSHVYS